MPVASARWSRQILHMNLNWGKLCATAVHEIEATLEELPKPLSERAAKLTMTFEPRPNAGLQADGIAPDTLG
jgi:hypothetical protein